MTAVMMRSAAAANLDPRTIQSKGGIVSAAVAAM